MPTYTYRCPRCFEDTELVHGMTEDPGPMCTCDGKQPPVDMDRVILSAPGFKLKGTGWYETDFKSK